MSAADDDYYYYDDDDDDEKEYDMIRAAQLYTSCFSITVYICLGAWQIIFKV